MSEDNVTVVSEMVAEKVRGPNGDVGKPTAALLIKLQWHAAHFKLVDTNNHQHPNRQSYLVNKGAPSLKQFARTLAKSGDETAKEWLGNKAGKKNQKRSDANVKAAQAAALATKQGRKKSKSSGKVKTEATA